MTHYPPAPPLPRLARHADAAPAAAVTSSAPDEGRVGTTLDRVTPPVALTTAGPPGDVDTQPIRLRLHTRTVRPDAASIAQVRRSFWLLGDLDMLSQRFDARLLCLTPRAEEVLRRLFPRDGERFITAVLRPVEALGAEHDPEPGADAEAQLRSLGARLHAVGLRQEDYAFIGLSLARAVRDSYSAEWTTTLGSAWSEIHNWLVPQLEAGARGARLTETERSLGARVMQVEGNRTASVAAAG